MFAQPLSAVANLVEDTDLAVEGTEDEDELTEVTDLRTRRFSTFSTFSTFSAELVVMLKSPPAVRSPLLTRVGNSLSVSLLSV